MSQIEVRVTQKRHEALDIISLDLSSADGSALPAFSAGSHIDVHTGGMVRQYSLCNDSDEKHRYMIGVLLDPNSRGGSAAIHANVAVGDLLSISEPRNHFPLVVAKKTILFAGGIGITPILCMAERLSQSGANFELHYCSRSQERTAFRERIARSQFAPSVHYHFDDGSRGQKLDIKAILKKTEPETHIYICGPNGFISLITDTALAKGWDADSVHSEHFSSEPTDTTGDRLFQVMVASTGQVFDIPIGVSVTRVLGEHGIYIPTSCEEGVCGTCVTHVLQGVPEHRDYYFTSREKAENIQFTPCCSRAKTSTLVLDL